MSDTATSWKLQMEIPAIVSISDDSPWINVRDSARETKEEAFALLAVLKARYEWPLRVVKTIQWGDTVLEQHVELEEMYRRIQQLEWAMIRQDEDGVQCRYCGSCGIDRKSIIHAEECVFVSEWSDDEVDEP